MTGMRWLSMGLVLAVAACGKDAKVDDPIGPAPDPNVAPAANFSSSCLYMQCDFTDASSDTDGSVIAWNWNFGDGQTSSERNPVHSYTVADDYTVTLTVTDDSSAIATRTRSATAAARVVTSLTCVDGSAPGGYVACKLRLQEPSGFKVVLNSSNCDAHGNVFRITEPVTDTLTVDGCYASSGSTIQFAGPFPAGTDISAEMIAPLLGSAPALRVAGAYPEWTLSYEDGADADFDDMMMTVTALPVP